MDKKRQCQGCRQQYGPEYPHNTCGNCGGKLHTPEAIAARKNKRIESKPRFTTTFPAVRQPEFRK